MYQYSFACQVQYSRLAVKQLQNGWLVVMFQRAIELLAMNMWADLANFFCTTFDVVTPILCGNIYLLAGMS